MESLTTENSLKLYLEDIPKMSMSNYIEYILKYAEKSVLKCIYQNVNNDLY